MRGTDVHGSGEWHATRGNRFHNGVDFSCYPGTRILAPVSGLITKLGYPYGDDLGYRYVQIEADDKDNHWRW